MHGVKTVMYFLYENEVLKILNVQTCLSNCMRQLGISFAYMYKINVTYRPVVQGVIARIISASSRIWGLIDNDISPLPNSDIAHLKYRFQGLAVNFEPRPFLIIKSRVQWFELWFEPLTCSTSQQVRTIDQQHIADVLRPLLFRTDCSL